MRENEVYVFTVWEETEVVNIKSFAEHLEYKLAATIPVAVDVRVDTGVIL